MLIQNLKFSLPAILGSRTILIIRVRQHADRSSAAIYDLWSWKTLKNAKNCINSLLEICPDYNIFSIVVKESKNCLLITADETLMYTPVVAVKYWLQPNLSVD